MKGVGCCEFLKRRLVSRRLSLDNTPQSSTYAVSRMRQQDLNSILRCDLQQPLDLFLSRRKSGCRTLGKRYTNFEEHIFETCGCDHDQQLRRLTGFILE